MVNKKSAPQQIVLSIERIGGWGRVEYHHTLECGHVEIRKRASTAPSIACTWCVVASDKGRELQALRIIQPPVIEEVWDFYDNSITDEVTVAKMRGDIASVIGCSQGDVEVVSTVGEDGILRVMYATIFLDSLSIKKILGKSVSVIDILPHDLYGKKDNFPTL